MATTYTVKHNQTMLNVIEQCTGSWEAGMVFCRDNNVSITDRPDADTVFIVSDEALALGDPGRLQYITENNVIIANANLPACSFVTGLVLSGVGATSAVIDFAYGDPSTVLGVEWVFNQSETVSESDVLFFESIDSYEGFADNGMLMPETDYVFHIRTVCDHTHSAWQTVHFTTTALALLFTAGRTGAAVRPYGITGWTITDPIAMTTVTVPFSNSLSIVRDSGAEATYLAFIQGLFITAGMTGLVYIDPTGHFYYSNGIGEHFGNVMDCFVLTSLLRPVYDNSLSGSLKIFQTGGRSIICWGDSPTCSYNDDHLGSGISLANGYGPFGGERSPEIYHDDKIQTLYFNDTFVGTPVPLLRIRGDVPMAIETWRITSCPHYEAAVDLDLTPCAAKLKVLTIDSCALITSFATSLFQAPMPNLQTVTFVFNNLSSAAQDAAVNDFFNNSWNGISGPGCAFQQNHNPATYTAASITARNALTVAGWTVN